MREFCRRTLLLLGAAVLLQNAEGSYGVQKSVAQCRAEKEDLRQGLLSGKEQPYAYWGAPDDCRTLGCIHPYWGDKCRFRLDPNCPSQLRHDLTGWLRYWSEQGADWARDLILMRPCELWPLLKGRTFWFVGDSMMQDSAYTLLCFMMEYMLPDLPKEDSRGPLPKYSPQLVKEIETDVHNKRVAYWCRGFEGDLKVCYLNADLADRAIRVVHLLPRLSSQHDVVIMNIGMHFNNLTELHEASKDLSSTIVSQRPYLPKRFYWKETTPQHYSTKDGMLDMTKSFEEQFCQPAGNVYGVNISIKADGQLVLAGPNVHDVRHEPNLRSILTGGHRNHVTIPSMLEAGIKVLPHWNVTLPLWQYHKHINAKGEGGACSKVACDCTHTCAPAWGQLFLPGFKDLLEADRDSGHRSAGISGARNPMERLASDRASETDSQGV